MDMWQNRTDKDWERLAAEDPYFAVITRNQYRRGRLDENALDEFFDSGRAHAEQVMQTIRAKLAPDFHPRRALDFGCGVGRVLIPLASMCESVVGVDVSQSMLLEAGKNCRARGVTNAELVRADDALSGLTGEFDFIHSFIVFQHIPVRRGERLAARLLDLLAEGGVAALHFTYCERASLARRMIEWSRKSVPLLGGLINVLHGRPARSPLMQTNHYDLNRIFRLLHERGCGEAFLQSTNHMGLLGVLIYCRKSIGNAK